MACPRFLPDSFLGGAPMGGAAAASPLGALFTGRCAADPSLDIPEPLLRTGCNTGYARHECPRAAAIEADAYRFRIKSHAEGIIQVAWSEERDHHPVAVGALRLAEAKGEAGPLETQARACIAVYLRRTGETW
jgi:hypothetical protein